MKIKNLIFDTRDKFDCFTWRTKYVKGQIAKWKIKSPVLVLIKPPFEADCRFFCPLWQAKKYNWRRE